MDKFELRLGNIHRLQSGDLLIVKLPEYTPYDEFITVTHNIETLRSDIKKDHGKEIYFLVVKNDIDITHYRIKENGDGS